MKFNHDADKVQDVFVGHTLDEDRVKALIEQYEKDPQSVVGSKKSETAEYIRSIADDPEALLVMSMMFVKGLAAARVMDKLQEQTTEHLKTMDITDMPKEIAEQILKSDEAPEEIKERIRREAKCMQTNPSTEESTDVFEELKRKYQ